MTKTGKSCSEQLIRELALLPTSWGSEDFKSSVIKTHDLYPPHHNRKYHFW